MRKPNSRFWWWTGYAGMLAAAAGFLICNVVYSGDEPPSRFKTNPSYDPQATVNPATRPPPTLQPTRKPPPSPTLRARVVDRNHLDCQLVEGFKSGLLVDQQVLGREVKDLELPLAKAARSSDLGSGVKFPVLEDELEDVEGEIYVWDNLLAPSVLDDGVESRMRMIADLIEMYVDAVRSLVYDLEGDPVMGEYLSNIVWNIEEIHKIADAHLAKCGDSG